MDLFSFQICQRFNVEQSRILKYSYIRISNSSSSRRRRSGDGTSRNCTKFRSVPFRCADIPADGDGLGGKGGKRPLHASTRAIVMLISSRRQDITYTEIGNLKFKYRCRGNRFGPAWAIELTAGPTDVLGVGQRWRGRRRRRKRRRRWTWRWRRRRRSIDDGGSGWAAYNIGLELLLVMMTLWRWTFGGSHDINFCFSFGYGRFLLFERHHQ